MTVFRLLLIALVSCLAPFAARAGVTIQYPGQFSSQTDEDSGDFTTVCQAAVARAEQSGAIPSGLLGAISKVESGRRDVSFGNRGRTVAWPWTVNAAGNGYFYPTKAQAIAAVEAFRAQGITSIDVGCMQVNLFHHPYAFASLEEAFDPEANARYGASFLKSLFQNLHGWPEAVAAYHSLTPALGAEYERHVIAVWNGREDGYRPPDFLPQVIMTGNGPMAIMAESAALVRPPVLSAAGLAQSGDVRSGDVQNGDARNGGGNGSGGIAVHRGMAMTRIAYAPPARIIRHPIAGQNAGSGAGTGGGAGRDLASYRRMPVRVAWRGN